jgi:hypothetical protein
MATSTTSRKPAPKAKSNDKAKPAPKKATGKAKASSTKKATPRPTYDEKVKAISTKARVMACPTSKQGPVPKQCLDVMNVLKDPRQALKEAGLTQAQVKKIAQGDGDAESRKKVRPLGERVAKAGGAPQWVRGRPLAAILVAWIESK